MHMQTYKKMVIMAILVLMMLAGTVYAEDTQDGTITDNISSTSTPTSSAIGSDLVARNIQR